MTLHTSPPIDDEQQPYNNDTPFLPENDTEFTRLLLLHWQLSELMGGLVPVCLDLTSVQRVLDVACGVGGWVVDMARTYPHMQVLGIDKSAYFIERARSLACSEEVSNAIFMVRDMHCLEGEHFLPESFDLIHLRFIAGEASPQTLQPLVQELVRLCRPGGFILWTESELPITNSLACEQLKAVVLRALQAAGRAFSPGSCLGITPLMGCLLRDAGCRVTRDIAHVLDVSAGTTAHRLFCRQAWVFGCQVRPFLLKTDVTTVREFEEVFGRMQKEIKGDTFRGMCFLRTVMRVKG